MRVSRSNRRGLAAALPALITGLAAATGGQPPSVEGPREPAPPETAPAGSTLSGAPRIERQTLDRLLNGGSWSRRAIAAMRLERYDCADSHRTLESLRTDEAWQVRAYAVRSLGRRRLPVDEGAFDTEQEPRVLRTALRYGYALDTERVGRGVRYLARSRDLEDKMLAVELGIASGDPDLADLATDTARKIILRMGRADAGALSPRLAAVTGQWGLRRHYRWQHWLRRSGQRFAVYPALSVSASSDAPLEAGVLSGLDPERFAPLESYIDNLSQRSVDLVICLDCTASMSGELAEAQGGVDDLMLFAGDVVSSLRVALVAYRDRRDQFETKAWDFTADIDLARRRLWSLTADGGGDSPEAVYSALRTAYGRLNWMPRHTKVLVLVGDGPPHVGRGVQCARMAKWAAGEGVTTHTIQADTRGVKHFPEIAVAGGGRCVSLSDRGGDPLIIEIAGLTLGERFEDALREFFRTYLELCR
jgi:Mg-chelatase subunit ChlD